MEENAYKRTSVNAPRDILVYAVNSVSINVHFEESFLLFVNFVFICLFSQMCHPLFERRQMQGQ